MHAACIKVKIKGKKRTGIKMFQVVAFGSLCTVLLGSFTFGSEDAPTTGGIWASSEQLWLLHCELMLQ